MGGKGGKIHPTGRAQTSPDPQTHASPSLLPSVPCTLDGLIWILSWKEVLFLEEWSLDKCLLISLENTPWKSVVAPTWKINQLSHFCYFPLPRWMLRLPSKGTNLWACQCNVRYGMIWVDCLHFGGTYLGQEGHGAPSEHRLWSTQTVAVKGPL